MTCHTGQRTPNIQSVIHDAKEKQGVAENDKNDVREGIRLTLEEGKTQNPVLLPFYVSRKFFRI